MKTRIIKLGLGLLSLALAAAQAPAAAPEINTARAHMRGANYQSMVTTLNPYITSNPNDQEARLLRAIGNAGVIAKNNLSDFLIQKGATRATIDPLNNTTYGTSVEFPMRPIMTTGKPWNKTGNGYTPPPGDGYNWESALLAWRNTGSTTRSFTINVTHGSSGFGIGLIHNGNWVGSFSDSYIYIYDDSDLITNIIDLFANPCQYKNRHEK